MKTRTSDRYARWFVLLPALAAIAGVVGGVAYYAASPDIPFLSRLLAGLAPPYFYYMAWIETVLAWRARSFFSPGQMLRFGWGWLSVSALLRLIGFILAYGLAFPKWGTVVSSLFAGSLACLGMARVIQALRHADWLRPLRLFDRVILGALCVYCLHHAWLVWTEIAHQGLGRPTRTLLWLVVPMLFIQTWQALLIRRSMLALGGGMLSSCWGAIAASALLLVAGNIGQLAQPMLSLTAGPWLLIDTIWILPYALSALAPALQIEASALALDSAALRALDEKNAGEDNRHRG